MNLSRVIGLDRDIYNCFICPVEEQTSIYCVIHPQQKSVLRTYLKDFVLIERVGSQDFFAIGQRLHRQVFCPSSSACNEVRHLFGIFFCENDIFLWFIEV